MTLPEVVELATIEPVRAKFRRDCWPTDHCAFMSGASSKRDDVYYCKRIGAGGKSSDYTMYLSYSDIVASDWQLCKIGE